MFRSKKKLEKGQGQLGSLSSSSLAASTSAPASASGKKAESSSTNKFSWRSSNSTAKKTENKRDGSGSNRRFFKSSSFISSSATADGPNESIENNDRNDSTSRSVSEVAAHLSADDTAGYADDPNNYRSTAKVVDENNAPVQNAKHTIVTSDAAESLQQTFQSQVASSLPISSSSFSSLKIDSQEGRRDPQGQEMPQQISVQDRVHEHVEQNIPATELQANTVGASSMTDETHGMNATLSGPQNTLDVVKRPSSFSVTQSTPQKSSSVKVTRNKNYDSVGKKQKKSSFVPSGAASSSLSHKEETLRGPKREDAGVANTLYWDERNKNQKIYTLKDPTDVRAISELVTYLVPKRTSQLNFMDPSLAFMMAPDPTLMQRNGVSTLNLNEYEQKQERHGHHRQLQFLQQPPQRFYNECLFVLQIKQYKIDNSNGVYNHGNSHDGNRMILPNISATASTNPFPKSMASTTLKSKKQKLYHVCIVRCTNLLLDGHHHHLSSCGVLLNGVLLLNGYDGQDIDEYPSKNDDGNEKRGVNENDMDDDDDEDDEDDDYSLLYNPHHQQVKDVALEHVENALEIRQDINDSFSLLKQGMAKTKREVPPELEQSSFPSLVFFEIDSDGTHPEIVQILDLDQLVAIENMVNSNTVKLVFQNGVSVELDCDTGHTTRIQLLHSSTDGGTDGSYLNKNRFLWSLLQIHAILCTSIVERKMRLAKDVSVPGDAAFSRVQVATVLPQVQLRNIDKAELQYIATVNGFLSDNPILCLLLERQRRLTREHENKRTIAKTTNKNIKGPRDSYSSSSLNDPEERNNSGYLKDEVDDIAYDVIMGNFNKLTLFFSEEEKEDAEEVLNSKSLKQIIEGTGEILQDVDSSDADTAGALIDILQKRMQDLEAETCRRLIAWEDRKQYSINASSSSMLDTDEAHSLSSLFHTLDKLDKELEDMEEWLSDKASAIKPLTDECCKVEEVNRQLEQQKSSLDLLSDELERLLGGLELEQDIEVIIKDPSSKMCFLKNGDIDISNSEGGIQEIYNAGKVLKMTFDQIFQEGGIHLRAVNERAEGLSNLSSKFCQSVADLIVAAMRRALIEATQEDDQGGDKNLNHVAIAKAMRSTQRRFQTSLLSFVKLIEVLALLKPSMLTSVRESYAKIVSEGIFSKKLLNLYFDVVTRKASTQRQLCTVDLGNYQPVALRSSPTIDPNNTQMRPAEAKGIEIALSDILPMIAREAYFTAALFGLSSKHLSGREKKQNFELAKKSVDYSSRHFKYFITRICGIASDTDGEAMKVIADPMLCLVSSIYLNEAMDNYIDRQRKGGEHSLSLAYVRATILDLRKKVDKQWVAWIEEQIKWVLTNPGVPLNGKRAGIFMSFSRFPSYLDHIMICCKAGRPKDQVPNLSRIKVITYYLQKLAASLFNSLHECSERESTDQQYAANVMRMENSYFFTQTIKQRGPELVEVFQKQITAASSICKQSTDAYLGFMIKREFKALHTLFASISHVRREVGDVDVPLHVPRSTFEKNLSKESNKEILKEKIGAIYYRMEKHLSEAGGLLPVAWKALVKVLYEWFARWEKLSSQCYKLSLHPSASDVVRIAKQAVAISAKKNNEEKKKGQVKDY